MPDRTSHSDLLADRARRDALRITPGFSESLHGRVMMSVNRARAAALAVEPAPVRPRLGYRIGSIAMAAGLALAVVPAVMFTFARPEIADDRPLPPVIRHASDSPGTLKKPQLALYATAHEMNSKVTNIVQTAMAEQQFAGLDHDVRAATAYLVEQVPLRSAWQSNQPSQER